MVSSGNSQISYSEPETTQNHRFESSTVASISFVHMQETRNDVQEPMVLLKKICVYIQNFSFCIWCKQSSHASLE